MPTLCRLISLVSHLTPVVSSFLSRTSPLSGYFSFTAPFLLLISLSPPCFIGSFFILTLQFLLRSGYLIPYRLFVIPLIYSPILYLESPPAPLFATLITSCFVPFLPTAHLLSQLSVWLSFHHIRLFSLRFLSTSCFLPPAHPLWQLPRLLSLPGFLLDLRLPTSSAFPIGSSPVTTIWLLSFSLVTSFILVFRFIVTLSPESPPPAHLLLQPSDWLFGFIWIYPRSAFHFFRFFHRLIFYAIPLVGNACLSDNGFYGCFFLSGSWSLYFLFHFAIYSYAIKQNNW